MTSPRIPHRPWYCPDIRELLAVIIVIGGGYMMWHKPALESAVTLMLGYVVGFYFGSSKGSDHKTDLLAKAPPLEKKGCCHE